MMEDIIANHERIARELRVALATMERSDRVNELHKELIENQKRCPHFSAEYNWAVVNGTCPYCGFRFDGGDK